MYAPSLHILSIVGEVSKQRQCHIFGQGWNTENQSVEEFFSLIELSEFLESRTVFQSITNVEDRVTITFMIHSNKVSFDLTITLQNIIITDEGDLALSPKFLRAIGKTSKGFGLHSGVLKLDGV